jgi:hypothetical protein
MKEQTSFHVVLHDAKKSVLFLGLNRRVGLPQEPLIVVFVVFDGSEYDYGLVLYGCYWM